jgi:pimeloyl-ACP methyl ester carboxylesterase
MVETVRSDWPPTDGRPGGHGWPGGMAVHESGMSGAPAVVFLHGAGASGRMWREHMARLGSFHCLAPDLPGFGASNRLEPLTRERTTDLVAELIEGHVPARRADIVGLSWGGGIAHTLLDRHPHLVGRAVIDGAGVLTARSGALILLGVRAVSPFLHTRPVTAFFRDLIGMDEAGADDLRRASPRAFRRAFVEGFRSGVSPVEVEAGSPTLLVAGEKESIVRTSNAALAELMPHAVARYAPGLGHGWLARELALHVDMVEAWLTGHELPARLRPGPAAPAAVERLRRELAARRPDGPPA